MGYLQKAGSLVHYPIRVCKVGTNDTYFGRQLCGHGMHEAEQLCNKLRTSEALNTTSSG